MSRKKMKIGNVATLVAEGVTLNGDIELKGQLIVAGNVNGAIKAEEDSCVVTVAETGCIKGELTAPVIEIVSAFMAWFCVVRYLISRHAGICHHSPSHFKHIGRFFVGHTLYIVFKKFRSWLNGQFI